MENDGAQHRRIRVRNSGLPFEGLYDSVIDTRLQALLDVVRKAGIAVGFRELCGSDGRLVARELASVVIEAMEARLDAKKPATAADIAVVNRLLAVLRDSDKDANADLTELLPYVLERIGPEPTSKPPDLSAHGLLTGREGTENLLLQLKRELRTCDRIDWLVSFIKLTAVKMLQTDIEEFLARGGVMRIVTTAYMGATDPAAIEELAAISVAHGRRMQIRFSRESDATRLHAKAYIHHRDSGFGNAYIGSANLSRPALTEGLEWTVRLSQAASPGLWSKIEETFEQWWGDPDFVEYGLDPDHPSQAQFRELVAREKGALDGTAGGELASLPIFDLQAKPFQQAILERIAVERAELGRTRHLIIAATGTGKTMIAAFDYRAFAADFQAKHGRAPRMLYVAHSERILKQARMTFAQVMRDLNFGGLLVGGKDDRPCEALFASIQSWNSKIGVTLHPADHFDYVVVDEVHHGEAPSWKRLLEWIRPKSLLGLTATPERADGLDITRHFEDRITADVRLPYAITQRLLVPFRYFGVTDSIDLMGMQWKSRGGYEMKLVERAYMEAGEQWIEGVRRAIVGHVPDPLRMRAIGFCSGVAHARTLADTFERARFAAESAGLRGIRAESLDGDDSGERREDVIGALRRGEIQLLFVADLLNEGVDIPEVDTVLFMRPTDSLTIFVQQLGRGLRLCSRTNKECLTVLDFVGQYRREFRFADRLGAMLADPSASIKSQVESGFTALPPGCSITLERVAKERVLAHINAQVRGRREKLIESLKQLRERLERTPTQLEYIETTRLDPRVFYTGDERSTWAGILQGAGLGGAIEEVRVLEPYIAPLRATASLTDRSLVEFGIAMLDVLERGAELSAGVLQDRRLQVLLVEFGQSVAGVLGLDAHAAAADVVGVLRSNAALRGELRSLLRAVSSRARTLSLSPSVPIPQRVPLALHHTYTRKQLFAGFGWEAIWRTTPQSGVAWIEEHGAYIMLVTLEKDEESFTERTRYRNFAITPTQFHWQSQATARPERGDGMRIVQARNGLGTMWLFVRRARKDDFGTEPYAFMGAFRPTKIEGMLPMSVTGDLANAMPAEWFEVAARAR